MHRIPLLALLLLALVPPALPAQDQPLPRPGAVVRMELRPGPYPRQVTGTLVQSTADSLVVRPADDAGRTVSLPLAGVERMDVLLGQRSRAGAAGRNGLIGGLVGGALGAALGALTYDDKDEGEIKLIEVSRGERTVLSALLGASALGGAGIVLGIINPGERWGRVSLAARATPSVSMRGDGAVAVAMSVRF